MVIQHEDGEKYPYYYGVDDISKRYFIANVPRDVSSRITIVAYNTNGATHSNEIVIPAVGFPDINPSFLREGNQIAVNGIPSTGTKITYCVTDAVIGNVVENNALNHDNTIDITNLVKGFYILHIEDGNRINASYKFHK